MRWPIALLLMLAGAQSGAAQSASVSEATSPIARSSALHDLIEKASRLNVLPDSLHSYKAQLETEVAILLRREDGNEQVAALEQVASTLRWTRAGHYDQRVIGYRAQQAGLTLSMLSITPTGWVQPTLYGSRFRLRRQSVSDSNSTRNPTDTMAVVHPLAADRHDWYRFTGGDTVVTLRLGDRVIPIVKVRVQPREDITGPAVLFDGEISLDAVRATLVRVRGHFVRKGAVRSWPGSLGTAVAFVEYEQGEYQGKYWLPAHQRIELQAAAPMLSEGRAVIRIVSRVFDMSVNDTVLDARTLAAADELRARSRRRLTYAPSDSVSGFDRWVAPMGKLTDGMHSDDFVDIGPDRWRPTGKPRFDIAAVRPSDIVHYNRIEGFYTGGAVKLAFRDAAPGLVARANAGFAWAEQTVRARMSLEQMRGPWTFELRAGRSLDNTNDFRFPYDSGSTFPAMFASQDAYDYVDRNSATVALVHRDARELQLRAELGIARDSYRAASLEHGVFSRREFRENRGVDEGQYLRTAAVAEYNPDVSAEFVKPGINARFMYERGDGNINWQRAELRVVARRYVGPFVTTARFDVGTLLGNSAVPQQLFEFGQQQNLPGYGDKEFAGSRAAMLRGHVLYMLPFMRQPIRVSRRWFLPALAPGISVGIQGGWAEVHNAAAAGAMHRLQPLHLRATSNVALSRPTDGVRATVSAGLRLFSGAIFVGMARPIDQAAPWRFVIGGQ